MRRTTDYAAKAAGCAELSRDLMFLFNEGNNYQSYNMLGAHMVCDGEVHGCRFAVWAPNARSVSVVCDANGWERSRGIMKMYPQTGIWTCFIEGALPGQNYKFSIEMESGEI